MKFLFFLFAALPVSLQEGEIKALYHSLNPNSMIEALAFYELYPENVFAKDALKRASDLLGVKEIDKNISLPKLINRMKGQDKLTEEELEFIEKLASHLPNRRLKGYNAETEKEIFSLSPDQIDLGKALLLSQLDGQADAVYQARCYSAMLDLMALQILSKLSSDADPEEKIEKTNHLIFDELHFRFPPQSIYADEIDRFTFLPSVMDNHLGVCLGVTALYLAIAQRIDLPLEIITPPGHIYVRFREGGRVVNIETTARGIHVPSEMYLSVATRKLQERNFKEVIGMTHVNQASTYLQTEQFEKAAVAYEKAKPYLSKDPMLCELLGYSYLLTGKKEEGEKLLKEVKDIGNDEGFRHQMSDDYLTGNVGLEGIKAVFMRVDDTRDSIVAKIERLQRVLSDYPNFRDGLEQLGVSWIQLNRAKEALSCLKQYHDVDPSNPVIEYYLSILHGERNDYKNCWFYLKNAERLTSEKEYFPKALKDLRRELMLQSPS